MAEALSRTQRGSSEYRNKSPLISPKREITVKKLFRYRSAVCFTSHFFLSKMPSDCSISKEQGKRGDTNPFLYRFISKSLSLSTVFQRDSDWVQQSEGSDITIILSQSRLTFHGRGEASSEYLEDFQKVPCVPW